MKKLIILILMFFYHSSYSQDIEKKIQGHWYVNSVHSEQNENVENYEIYSGHIISFDNGKLTLRHINYENLFYINYTIERMFIFSDSLSVEIVSLPPDNFRVRFDNGYVHELIKFPFGQSTIDEFNPEILPASSWILSMDELDYSFRLEFSKSEFEFYDDSTFELYTRAAKEMDFDYCESFLNWRYFNFQQQPFLSLSLFPFHSFPIQIIRYSGDTIYAKAWNENSFIFPYLHKVTEIDIEKLSEIKENIVSKKWKAIQIDYPLSTGADLTDDIRIKERTNYFLENNLAFKFTVDSLLILLNETIIERVTWNLTGDGKFIRLINEGKLKSYLEIVELGPESITLRNDNYFTDKLLLNAITEFTIILK